MSVKGLLHRLVGLTQGNKRWMQSRRRLSPAFIHYKLMAERLEDRLTPSLGVFPTNPGSYVFDTDAPNPTLTLPGGSTLTGALSGGVAVFTFTDIAIGNGMTLTGSGANPLALVSENNIVVSGTGVINVSGQAGTGGPGGGFGGSAGLFGLGGSGGGPGGGSGGSTPFAGGGGGGFGGMGGNGASGQGGSTYGGFSTPLLGGSGGGGGSGNAGFAALGGGGGGGAGGIDLLAAQSITISGTGILADGGTGTPGSFGPPIGGGGGGGSGGDIALCGSSVTIMNLGTLEAVGGAGGSGYGAGGGGGGGRVFIEAGVGGFTNNGTINVSPGAGGGTNGTAGNSGQVTIQQGPTITTASLTNWTAGLAGYVQTINTTGGVGPLTFSASGTLPPGLSISNACVLSGTPSTSGSYIFTITGTDSLGVSTTQSYEVTINPTITISPNTLPADTVNVSYNQTIAVSGGTGFLTYSETETLPVGLTLSSAGVLSGTPTAVGSYTFTVTATDTVGATGSQSYTVTINPAITIGPNTLPDWTAGTVYNQTISATGGTGALTFSETGILPTGLTLSSSGVISGMPTTPGSYTFTVTATDTVGATASQTYTVTSNGPVTITTATLASWTANQTGYNQTISATGGTGPLTFSSMPGTLPSGLTLSSMGVLSGTPNAASTYAFTVTATDMVGATASQNFLVTINLPVAITTTSLANWTVNQPNYSQPSEAGLIAFWSGNGNANDSIGNNNGTLVNGVNYGGGHAPGQLAFSFDGSSYVQAGTVGFPTGNQNRTLDLWFNVKSVVAVESFLAGYGGFGSGGQAYEIYVDNNTSPNGVAFSTWLTAIAGPTVNAGQWYNLAVTNSGNVTSLYLNGMLVTSGTLPINTPSGTNFYIGDLGDVSIYPIYGDKRKLNGFVDDVALFDTALSASKIQGLMASETSPFPEPWISATGGTGPDMFSLTAGILPLGLTLTSNGLLSGTPTVAGSYSFTVSATDAVGATGSQPYNVTINPPVTITTTSLLNWTVNQPGYSQTIVVTGGTGTLTFNQTGGTLPAGLILSSTGVISGTPTATGSSTFTVKVTDSTGALDSLTYSTIVISPAAKLAFGTQLVNTPTGVSLPAVTVQIEDALGHVVTTDNTDIVTVGIASGPGSFTRGSITTATAVNGVATFNDLTLVTPGTYTLSEIVPTLYTGPYSTPFNVVPLQVVPGSFAGTPSGFSLQFNAPFLVNSMTPVLYGQGYAATGPTPSVTLTQTLDGTGHPANMPVAGSLVLNTATNTITFLATNTSLENDNASPLLPDGTYTVFVHSNAANDGLQALNYGGGFLDGLGNGAPGSGDYTQAFLVKATTYDVVWVPSTADGPGQALNAPGQNQVGGGYPVYLADHSGTVTDVQAMLTYDPTLLTVTPTSTTTFTVTVPSPGTVILQYNGAALPKGSQTPIGYITATVPSGTVSDPTPYKAKDLLHLSGVTINGSSSNVVTADGLHLVAYVGDADGNGMYSSNDAVHITRALLNTDNGFTAYPLVDPMIVADTDGRGFIPADAALQANEAGVGFPTANLPIPPIPSGVVFQPIANNVDPSLSIPRSLQVGADGVTVPVNINDAHPQGSTGLIQAHLALTFDPRVFSVSTADVHPGSLLAGGGWSIVPTIDNATGQIGIALSSDTPITSTSGGSLVIIDFHQVGATSGRATFELVASASPNGQFFATELEDAQGTFTLTPAPTNGFEARIDSIVVLTLVPAAASISTAAAENTVIAVTGPAETSALAEACLANLPAVATESGERAVLVTTETTAIPSNTVGEHVIAVATSPVSMNLSTPITGLAFQFGSTVVANVQTSAGLLSISPSLINTFKNAIEQVMINPMQLPRPSILFGLNGDDASSDLDGQMGGDMNTLVSHRDWLDMTPGQDVDSAALDQYFAQTVDDTE